MAKEYKLELISDDNSHPIVTLTFDKESTYNVFHTVTKMLLDSTYVSHSDGGTYVHTNDRERLGSIDVADTLVSIVGGGKFKVPTVEKVYAILNSKLTIGHTPMSPPAMRGSAAVDDAPATPSDVNLFIQYCELLYLMMNDQSKLESIAGIVKISKEKCNAYVKRNRILDHAVHYDAKTDTVGDVGTSVLRNRIYELTRIPGVDYSNILNARSPITSAAAVVIMLGEVLFDKGDIISLLVRDRLLREYSAVKPAGISDENIRAALALHYGNVLAELALGEIGKLLPQPYTSNG